MIINAINGNGNRLIRVNKDTNKDAVKEFLVTTLSQCDTNGHFIETPYSESKLLDKPEFKLTMQQCRIHC